jgi:hypothetical protein
MAKAQKYSQEMVDLINAVEPPFNLSKAVKLAEHPVFVAADITPRGLVAKALTMGLEYQKQAKTSKTGEPIMRKETLVAEIEALTGLDNLDSLGKADKAALKALVLALSPRSVNVA